ncbi:MAG: hypothetical protein WKF71_10100 [Pyrinomonadaceae bacterium]
MRQTINQGRVSYEPNTLAGGCPFQAAMKDGGFHTFEERVDAKKSAPEAKAFTTTLARRLYFSTAKLQPRKNILLTRCGLNSEKSKLSLSAKECSVF